MSKKSQSTDSVPLVADVDGTLLRTDLLLESVFRFIRLAPFGLLNLPFWLKNGKAVLKARLAGRVELRPESLPFNQAVLDFLKREKQKGRPVYLASASDRRYIEALAEHLGFVDGVLSSDGRVNLAGSAKAERLVEAFGDAGFDYIGNERRDLQVWRHARKAILVDASDDLARRVREIHPDAEVLSQRRRGVTPYLRAVRPHQWLKNLLIFVPMLAAHRGETEAFAAASIAFVAFGLCASGVYVLNDLFDLAHDRDHPTKRTRPFASGEIPIVQGLALAPLLVAAGLALASTLSLRFITVMAIYLGLTSLYSVYLKRKMLLDVLTLSGLYTIRLVAGGVATSVVVSPWLFAFSLFLFLALAIVKRETELVGRLDKQDERAPGRSYRPSDLIVLTALAAASGFNAVLVLALYMNSETVNELYQSPAYLWLICPLLMYWVGRLLMLSHRGHMDDDPVVFALTDRPSLLVGLLAAGLVVAATLP